MKKKKPAPSAHIAGANTKEKTERKTWLTYEERKAQPDLDQKKIDGIRQKMETATLDDAGWTEHCKTVAKITWDTNSDRLCNTCLMAKCWKERKESFCSRFPAEKKPAKGGTKEWKTRIEEVTGTTCNEHT